MAVIDMSRMADEEAIGALVADWQAAWDAHEMNRTSPLFTDDADFVNVHGVLLQGRAAIVQHHVALHAGPARSSGWATERLNIRWIGVATARAHVAWSLLETENGVRLQGLLSLMLVKSDDGGWRIAVAHNTNVTAPT
jgi:uncharacterized protein (TIGR02246 family)